MLVGAGFVGAVVAGVATTAITIAGTPDHASGSTGSATTVTVTASPTKPPAPLPTAEADQQTCHAYGTVDNLITAAGNALNIIPQGMPFTDPAVKNNPAWTAGVMRAADIYGQAAEVLASQTAPGTSTELAQVADTGASALRAMSIAYKTFDPDSGKTIDVWIATEKTLDWLCRK
jgi:hypothetical protein